MKVARLNASIVFCLAALTYVGAVALKPTQHITHSRPSNNIEDLFPRSFGSWSVDENTPATLVSPDTAALIEKIYQQTLSRTYVDAQGHRIMLSVAYGGDQSDGTRAHRPEVCYPAQGFEILNNRRVELSISGQHVLARELFAKQGERYEPIVYWIVVGDRTATSGTEQKLAQLHYGLRGIISDGMLVRVSSIDRDEDKAQQIHLQFLNQMFLAMEKEPRSRVFGVF